MYDCRNDAVIPEWVRLLMENFLIKTAANKKCSAYAGHFYLNQQVKLYDQ